MTHSIFPQYAITEYPTPVFNTPDLKECFGQKQGNSLPLDEQGLFRPVETVLFPGSRIELLKKITDSSIWRIKTDEYPYEGNYYIDERFIRSVSHSPSKRTIELPPVPKLLVNLELMEGTRYIWGGNWPTGIDLLPHLYPCSTPLDQLDPLTQDTWKLKGVDCTGLIYYVTNGWTPRNSGSLLNFGRPVLIEGLKVDEIFTMLQDLDLIVWAGHVVCVLDQHSSIESLPKEGVIKYELIRRLSQIMKERKPVNDWDVSSGMRFVVRRWHPDNF